MSGQWLASGKYCPVSGHSEMHVEDQPTVEMEELVLAPPLYPAHTFPFDRSAVSAAECPVHRRM
ncbi:MAG: hypothetical protein PVSMB1_12900 [Gemmatimonadaceae bacterium]